MRPGRTPTPPIAQNQFLRGLLHCLKEALPQESRQRYGLPIALRHTETFPAKAEGSENRARNGQASEPRAGLETDIYCHSIDLVVSSLRLTVGHVGGNVYEIHSSLEEESDTWACGVSDSKVQPRMPLLGKKMSTFCLSVIEKKTGRLILKQFGEPPSADSTGSNRPNANLLPEAVNASGTSSTTHEVGRPGVG